MIHNDDLTPDLKVCSRCIYDDRVASIQFDEDGVCNYCHQVEALAQQYQTGKDQGVRKLNNIIKKIKKAGKNKKYDCIVGVSGGTDSSYMCYLLKKWGLRPLAVHYDNTWNTAIATQNIRKILTALDIDLYTHVVSNEEVDDIFKAFFKAGVAEIEASTDLALAEVMYRAAWKYNVKYVFEGHSFITEGITPVGKNYFDGRYIKSIHKMFGNKKIKSYPLMTLSRFLFWTMFAKIRKIRPFWYMSYDKEDARTFLESEYDWQYYGGHHLENRMTAFCHTEYLPKKFNADMRNNTLSALVRNGKMTREVAWKEYCQPPVAEKDLVDYLKKRLKITDEEYDSTMSAPPKRWTEYPTYKKIFEFMRPLFHVLAKADLVPMSFYLKYCFPVKDDK